MLTRRNIIRDDVLDESLDEQVAPSLGGVVIGTEHRIYVDPVEFFSRTLITESMAEVLENVANVVAEGKGSKVLVLSAFFGGGKTHTLIALYHAIKNPTSLKLARAESKDIERRISAIIEKLRGVEVIVIDGSIAKLAPSPANPLDAHGYKVNTLWGCIAHVLGLYGGFRDSDELLVPPQIDNIANLLSNRRLVIIVDELPQYLLSLYGAGKEELRNYAKNVVIFFERLVKAVETLSNVVLVISLPVKYGAGGEGFEVEKIYQTDIISSLLRSIQRVVARYIEPVKPGDIPALLRVRLFNSVDSAKAKEVEDILRIEYDRNRNVFGDVAPDTVIRIKDTYPFHPLYIDVLLDILDKHKGLQKTRDLIRISRKVVRTVINDRENAYDLIMPWHIDVERDDIRNILLSSDYEVFRLPIEEDIVKRCSSYEKPWLAKAVAKALFVKTFVYGGGLAPKVEFFPTLQELAVLTYEPGLFGSRNAQPKDIAEAIKWITNNLLYVLSDARTQRLWFTYITSPIKLIESTAQKVIDADAYKKLLEAVEDLLREPVESIIDRKRKKEEIRVFSIELSRVNRECKPIDIDTRKYIVYVCLDIDAVRRREILEDIIYRTSSGGSRRYANTVYVVFPEHKEKLIPALDYAKKVIACDERESVLDAFLRELNINVQELEIAKEIYRRKLDEYCRNAMLSFYNSILEALSKVAYPVMKDGVRTVDEIDLFIRSTSIVYVVEQTLSSTGLKKVRSDLDFDTFRYLLNSIGVDLNAASKRVSDIIDYFYSNPRLPAIPEEAIKEAIAEGIRRLEIGLRCGNRVYYKEIESCSDEWQCLEKVLGSEGKYIGSKAIANECEVLLYVDALRAQMESLRGREWVEGGAKYIEDYYIILEGKKLVRVSDVLSDFENYDPEVLREAPLVKLVKKVVVYLEHLEPAKSRLSVKSGEEVEYKVVVRRSGPFKGVLRVDVDNGYAEPKSINADESFTEGLIKWVVKAPSEPGTYSYELKLITEEGTLAASTRIDVFVEAEIEKEFIEGVPPEGVEIESMRISIEGRDLKPLNVLRGRLGGLVTVREASFEMSCAMKKDKVSTVSISMSNVGLDDLLAIILNVMQRFGLGEVTSKMSLGLVSVDGKSFKMPMLSNEEIDTLSKHRVLYKPIKKQKPGASP